MTGARNAVVIAWALLGCSSSRVDATATDAPSTAEACLDAHFPRGACATGARCDVKWYLERCPGGGQGLSGDLSCTCASDGTWACTIANAGKSACLLDGGVLDDAECAKYDHDCPAGCQEAVGQPLDETHGCFGAARSLGCRPLRPYVAGYTCFVDASSGTAYRIVDDRSPVTPGWSSSCTASQHALVTNVTAPLCAAP